MAIDEAALVATFEWQRVGVERASPLYHRVLGWVIEDFNRGGPCHDVLWRRGDPGPDPAWDAYVLRFLGGLHRLVLTGDAEDVTRWYPSAGGSAAVDEPGLEDALAEAVERHAHALVEALTRPVQTNEVGRCAALLIGFLAVSAGTALPLRILEIGASAGLNLRWDHYWYEGGLDGSSFGDPDSPLRFDDIYREPLADLSGSARVAERRGCDRRPIDPLDDEGLLTLRSFVWPDQLDRLAHLDAAVEVARRVPIAVEQADAAEWLAAQLAEPRPGMATVVFQSIVWQYLPSATKAAIESSIRTAGAAAAADAPVAWLTFEPAADPSQGVEVRLTLWPDGRDRLLTRGGYHGKPVRAVGRATA